MLENRRNEKRRLIWDSRVPNAEQASHIPPRDHHRISVSKFSFHSVDGFSSRLLLLRIPRRVLECALGIFQVTGRIEFRIPRKHAV